MAQYDISSKYLWSQHPEELLQFFLNRPDVEFITQLNTEQTTFRTHRGDNTLRVRLNGQETIVHVEVQSGDSAKPMWARLSQYCGFLIGEYQLPVCCIVVYLGQSAGQNDLGYYSYDISGFRYLLQYQVVRLSEMDGESVLAAGVPALLPLTPLMKPPAGMDAETWLGQCVSTVEKAAIEKSARDDLVALLGIFSLLIYDIETISKFIEEAIMAESTFFQEYFDKELKRRTEELREQLEKEQEEQLEQLEKEQEVSLRKSAVESVIDVLEMRFESSIVQALKPALDQVGDPQQLRQLRRSAVQVPTLEAFAELLTENGN